MLTVTGITYIVKEPEERKVKNGYYFNLEGVSKNPYGEGRKHYKISVYVSEENIEEARTKLVKGTMVQLRIGELDGKKNADTNSIYMQVNTNYRWIEPLRAVPEKNGGTNV